jgi:hypothetical protein
MPEVARFYGIVIKVFFGDHPPPHFHAIYGEYNALVNIDSLEVFERFAQSGGEIGVGVGGSVSEGVVADVA